MNQRLFSTQAGLRVARSELILGGQRSGKTRRAESLARTWLAAAGRHRAVYLATAQPWDDEMRQRIQHHQAERARHAPGLHTVEVAADLAGAMTGHSDPDTLVLVDCLTLWLTGLLMPAPQAATSNAVEAVMPAAPEQVLREAVGRSRGPVVLVSNEIGLGVIPMGREVRNFVDALGRLNQQAAAVCQRVTLMAAGLPLTLKDEEAR